MGQSSISGKKDEVKKEGEIGRRGRKRWGDRGKTETTGQKAEGRRQQAREETDTEMGRRGDAEKKIGIRGLMNS
jgi:hypothetical protein